MSSDSQDLSVSCVIGFHREGLLAHTTLHSIGRARKRAESEGIHVQCVITLDRHDALTERIVGAHPLLRHGDIIDIVRYGDAGQSRNHAINRASGDYIIIVDGDDYCSNNFISVLARQAAQNKNSVFFPEYLFSFGLDYSYLKTDSFDSMPQNMYALFSANLYYPCLAARRDIFLHIPFVRCDQGVSYEDWFWVCEAVAAGVKFRPAHDVVLFYRRRAGSRLEEHTQGKAIIPPSAFFAMLPPPPDDLPDKPPAKPAFAIPIPSLSCKVLLKELLFTCLHKLPSWIARPLFAWLKAAFGNARVTFPPVVQKALLEVAEVDGMLHPNVLPYVACSTPCREVLPGKVYAIIWHSMNTCAFDVVYVVTHIGVGGADLMSINYMSSSCREGKRVLCILTQDSQNDLSRLPEGVTAVHFGEVARCLNHSQKQAVLTRLLVQLRPSVIHVVGDWGGFELLQTYGSTLRSQSRLCASVFSDAQDDQGIHIGVGTRFLRALVSHDVKIITDNMVVAREWHSRLGLPLQCFQAVYGIAHTPCPARCDNPPKGNKVLWAGRLDKEKRMDILLSLVQALPDVSFDVWGRSVLDQDSAVKALALQPNVVLQGEYRDFYDLPLEQYAVFVYTTQFDGLPNVLLEAAACGLPLIAPDRGGITDFVTEETGWLIASHTDVHAYVYAIQAVLANPDEAMKRVQRAQDLLRSRHTPEAFATALMQAYGAIPSLGL